MGLTGHATIAVAGIVGSVALVVLGQSSQTIPDELTKIGPPVLGLGAAGWFIRWLLYVYIPEQNKRQDESAASTRKSIENLAETHERVVTNLATKFEDNINKQHEHFRQEREWFFNRLQIDHPADANRPANH